MLPRAAHTIRATSKQIVSRQVSSAATAVKRATWRPVARKSSPSVTTAASTTTTPATPSTVVNEQDYDVPPEMDAMIEGRATTSGTPPRAPAASPSSMSATPTFSPTFPDTSATFPSTDLDHSTSIPLSSTAFDAAGGPQTPGAIDWQTSYHGLATQPFSQHQASILMRPLLPNEIEIKPDGLLYLPEILYRRILNQAFGPGGWGMVPRGDMTVTKNMVSREWGLVVGGRLVSIARGEQTFFDPSGLATATEGCKSNALMRCCKDLGIASELWDPSFIRQFKVQHCVEAWTEHISTKKKQKRWRKKGNKFEYPYKDPSA
ncbi:hypothetical protein OIO90_005371 [Microbotryomycetes sp. JL221]|nr:hypothetical protein OIO90_005371 [Microbotryomycetes sp. JL221]